jgi:hypothetical protein
MKSAYVELEKEFDCPGFTALMVTVGATVYSTGDVEGPEAYIGAPKKVYLTHLICQCDLQSLNEEFILVAQDQYFDAT